MDLLIKKKDFKKLQNGKNLSGKRYLICQIIQNIIVLIIVSLFKYLYAKTYGLKIHKYFLDILRTCNKVNLKKKKLKENEYIIKL